MARNSDQQPPVAADPGDGPMTWETMQARAENGGLLGKQLYVVYSFPTDGMGPTRAHIPEHVTNQRRLEREGVLAAAGPLAGRDGTTWNGEGLFVLRAESLEQALEIAKGDPMHAAGARTFELRPWLLNEGSIDVRIPFSTGSPTVR